ncbi:DUF2911 domain-containing protein [Fulvivirga sp.]|uniref:DUF2911 domain-containing protein n=1 Tax=Fulvivirga sp. TaxID=1931237 RepID=UPI0032ECD295
MKLKYLFTGLFAMSALAASQIRAQGVVFTPQVSGAASVSQKVGITDITVTYSRPSVIDGRGNDRSGQIWGQLVPYGFTNLGFGTATEAPWRAGANENTIIEFSTDAEVAGKPIKAGKYGFHVAVYEDGKATLIFSNETDAWGSYFYDKADDVLRVDVQSEEIDQTNLLTYHFVDASLNEATLALDWEKKRIPIDIKVNTPELVYANFEAKLQGSEGFNIQSYQAAANYLVQNNIHLDAALRYASAAVEGQFFSQKNFNTMALKAGVLTAMGKNDESDKVMEEALELPDANAGNYYNYGRQLIGQDKDAKAMEIFKAANKKWSDNWLAPHGLARGYSAMGDYKNALKYERIAIKMAPEQSKQFLEGFIKTLEEGKDFN